MKCLPTFLQDTKHTLEIIEEMNDKIDAGELSLEGVAVVSLDIVSMYNNMSEDLGTEACKEYLESRICPEAGKESFVSTSALLAALELCLHNNVFSFNKKNYTQIRGVGTGVKLAPTYACLGLGKYEKMMFNSDQPLLENILLWKRFIDDIFMLFRGSKEECEQLVIWLNSLIPGVIEFKFEFSYKKIEFLDLEISIEEGRLKTNLFIKPSNKQLYLEFNSNHPSHCREGIPYSQALRVVERCTTPEDQDTQLVNLKEKLLARKYPEKIIEEKFTSAKKKNRREMIFGRKNKKNDDKIRLIFTHNKINPPVHMWMRQCKDLLTKNDEAKALGNRIQISTRQPKNLLRMAGGYRGEQGVQKIPNDAGCFKCNRCKVSCPILNQTKTFSSTNTGKSYKIRQHLDCTSDWLIYLSTCKKCKGQYVGKSKTPFKLRHSNHKQEIKKSVGGLGHHYGPKGKCGYSDMSVTLIEQVAVKTFKFLANRELWWQHQLRVYVQNGGNCHCYRKEFQ